MGGIKLSTILDICQKAKAASYKLAVLSTSAKNKAILEMANAIEKNKKEIIKANEKDIESARSKGLKEALIERLMLNDARIEGMISGLNDLCDLQDPVGTGTTIKRPNGLTLLKQRVPLV